MKNTFILNDENKPNQYGFRVRNAGLLLDRFRANPVMLDSHYSYGTGGVIGKWDNIRIEGSLLKADAVFDEENASAQEIKRKVEAGFLKGASLGLDPFSMDNFVLAADGIQDLIKAEILEASIVAIPNNANAIKLYAVEESAVNQFTDQQVPQILLMVKEKNTKIVNMNKIKLTAMVAMALALNPDMEHNPEDVFTGILKLKADLDKANQKIDGFEQLEKDKKTKLAADTVAADILAGKIDATKKDDFVKLYLQDSDMYKNIIAQIPGRSKLAGQAAGSPAASEVKTLDDFEKLTLTAQLDFKANNPEAYQALFK